MTDQPLDLAAIQRRANAATGGPWTWDGYRVPALQGVGGNELYSFSTEVIEADHGGECGCRSSCELNLNIAPADAEFIAHARTDVPALVARIRELEAHNAQLHTAYVNAVTAAEGAHR